MRIGGIGDVARVFAVKPILSKPFGPIARPSDDVAKSARAECSADRSRSWGCAGTLDRSHLTLEPDGKRRFNVEDASGFEGWPKCNLFAFEIAQRAGFRVPLVERSRGCGFPGADDVARAAGRGEVEAFAEIVDAEPLESLASRRAQGACLLLVSAAPGSAMGHAVVVDRVLHLERDAAGRLACVRYVGWEALPEGSIHREGTFSSMERGGRFEELHLLQLRPADTERTVLSSSLSWRTTG